MMVTKAKAPAPAPVAKRAAPRKRPAPAAEPVAEATQPPIETAKPNLLRAGLQALDKARQDVAERQSRVFEAILGFEPAQGLAARENAAAKLAAEAFGLRKFEAVFDQRVAHALERMGVPSADALKALVDEVAAQGREVAALRAEVASLKSELRNLKAARRR
jgi:hypothetical protein